MEDGLSQGFILDAVQTRSGFLWFATLDGLNRFDGISFEVFRPEAERHSSMPPGQMRRLLEDSRRFLWILFSDGLGFMDQQTERFFYLPEHKIPPFGYLCEDAQGRLWGHTADKVLYRLTFPPGETRPEKCLAGLRVDSFPLNCKQETGTLFCLAPMDSSVWIGAQNGVFELPATNGSCTRVAGLPKNQVSGIWRDTTDGAVWLFSDARLHRLFKGQLQSFELEGEPITGVKKGVSNGRITCFFSRQCIYQWRNSQLHQLPYRIPEGIISGCVDREGILWIGTNARGVRKIPLDHFYFDRLGQGMSLARRPLYDRNGQLWLSASRSSAVGFNRYEQASGRSGDAFTSVKNISYLIQSRTGRYWGLFSGNVLCRMDGPGDRQVCYVPPRSQMVGYSALMEDGQGRILLGASGGALTRFDPSTEQWTEHSFVTLFSKRSPILIQDMAEDRVGRIWIGTTAGLVVATPEKTGQSYDFQLFQAPKTLTDSRVLALLPDPADSDICWVGTQHGLNRLNLRSGECRQFTGRDGLPNDVICSILPEDGRRIWLGTYFGLLEFDTRSFTWRHFTTADGLPCNEFNHQAALRLPDGRLFFGGVDGFTIFRPEDTRRSFYRPPRLYLTSLSIGTRRVIPGDSTGILQSTLPFTKSITLKHDQDDLFFQFALLDYFRSQGNHYAFRLRSLHKDWYNSGAVNQANYFNVPPGKYVFEVIARNQAGVQSEPVTLNITILKPWWHTVWAYTLYVVLTLVLIAIAVLIWLDRVRMNDRLYLEHREAKRLKELEQFKSRLFSNYTHEFRTPLAIIRGLADQLAHTTKGAAYKLVADIQHQTDEMLQLTGQILDLAKLEEKQIFLYPEPVDLTDYISHLCESFKSLAAERQINCSWQLPAGPIWAEVDVARLRDILANLISNALKFTPEGGTVTLVLHQPDDRQVQISVRDTGIGIAPGYLDKIFERYYQVKREGRPTAGTGIGLSYVAELTRLMDGRIEVQSDQGQGSIFTLTLPVQPQSGRHAVAAPEAPRATSGWPKAVPLGESYPVHAEHPLLLIIEDNIHLSKLVASYVSDHYRVEFAVNGRAGLEKTLDQVPDVVICDLRMPEMDGFEYCKSIRANKHTSHIPVIILTAFVDEADRLKALQAGVNAWLSKPVNPEILRQQLDTLLDFRRQMRRQILKGEQDTVPQIPAPVFEMEKAFLDQVMGIIAKKYDDPAFTVTDIQRALNLSKSQLHRKLLSVSGHPANYFIRRYRLEEAKKLLIARAHLTVAEVAYRVGFSDPNYFSRVFSAEFGKSPSAFRIISSS